MIVGNQDEIEARQTPTETQPLLKHVVVEPLRLSDIPAAVDNYYGAFSHDPFHRYIGKNLVPGHRRPSIHQKTDTTLSLLTRSATKLVLTIDHGAGILAASFPNRNLILEKLLEGLHKIILLPYKLLIMPAERRRRLAEVEMKCKQSEQDAGIEEHIKNWVYVDLLFAAKGSQGRGYGSALMRSLTDRLDSLGHTCWLYAHACNEGFYARHGFKTIFSVTLGTDNPEWHEEPVPVNAMVRQPKSGLNTED